MSWIETVPGSPYRSREEMDPLNAEVGSFDPFPLNPNPSYESLKFGDRLYEDGGNPLTVSNECTLDGIPWDCFDAASREGKSANLDPTSGKGNGSSLTNSIAVWVRDDSLDWGEVDPETQMVSVYDGGGGHFEWVPGPPLQTSIIVPKEPIPIASEELGRIRSDVEKALSEKKCADFLKALLDEAAIQTGEPYRDIMVTFDNTKFFYGGNEGFGGIALGRFEEETARANLMTFEKNFISKDRSAFIRTQTAQNALAETLHHLGTHEAYDDAAMANALNAIYVRKGLDVPKRFSSKTLFEATTASNYWHPSVMTHCAMRYDEPQQQRRKQRRRR